MVKKKAEFWSKQATEALLKTFTKRILFESNEDESELFSSLLNILLKASMGNSFLLEGLSFQKITSPKQL